MKREQLDALLEAVENEQCRRSLYAFVKRFWPVVEPGSAYIDNWHVEAICEHLQAVTEGKIKRLVINVPFRTAKSTITSVLWPAWVWIDKPQHQWLCGSYAEKLSIRDSLKMRRLVQSPEYRKAYGRSFDIASDQNQKQRFQNSKNGHRIAFSMSSGVMGDGGDTLLIDDPHDRQGAHSEAERETALTTYDEALVTRLNNPATGAIVVIMQRLHQKDLSGHVLARKDENWVHLMIPMEFEPERKCSTPIGWSDPRKKAGELMFPARFPKKTVESLKTTLGDYGAAGQLQQRPSPAGGGILKPEHIKMWPAKEPLPDLLFIVQSYDTAYTEQTQNDPTANTTWGVFEHQKKRCVLLLESWAEHMEYPQLRKRLIDDYRAEYGGIPGDPMHPSRRSDVVLVESKGSGQSIVQDLRAASVPVIGYNPGRADKIARAHMTAPILELGVFYVLESKKDPGQPIRWARPLLKQMEEFPNGEHDDLCVARGTLIEMADGTLRPVEMVAEGDFVATPSGARKVLAARMTGHRPLWKLRAGCRTLLATGNHPVCLSNGIYEKIDTLKGQKVRCRSTLNYLQAKLKSWCSTVVDTAGIQTPPTRRTPGISGDLALSCTGMFGRTLTAQSQMDSTFTTRTRTPQTTTYKTSLSCRALSIEAIATLGKSNTADLTDSALSWLQSESLRKIGTDHQKGASGIARTPSVPRSVGKMQDSRSHTSASRLTRLVSGAAQSLWLSALRPCFALAAVRSKSRDTAALAKARPLSRTSDVFNLTVDGDHCYYANGILTHNCDTLTQTAIYLRDAGMLELQRVPDEEPKDIDYHERKRSSKNPYFS